MEVLRALNHSAVNGLETGFQRVVVALAVHLQQHAAHEGSVNLFIEHDRFACHCGQFLSHACTLFVVKRHSRRDGCLDNAVRLVIKRFEGGNTALILSERTALAQDLEEVEEVGVNLTAKHGVDDLHALLLAQ